MNEQEHEALMEKLETIYEGIEGTRNAIDYLEDHCHENRLSCVLKQIRIGVEREQEKLFQIMGRPPHLESPTGEDVPFD